MDSNRNKFLPILGILFLLILMVIVVAANYGPLKTLLSRASIQLPPATSIYNPRLTEKMIPPTSLLAIRSSAGTSGEKKYGRDIIPTVLGTVSDYTGTATFDYSFILPQGPAGFSPSLGLSYSSQTVDDARAGIDNWKEKDAYMPSVVGHGFSLQSGGYVVRDPRGDLGRPLSPDAKQSNHRFIVVLPGAGSFELKYNSATNKWVSIPQGFLNVAHSSPINYVGKYKPSGFNFYMPPDSDGWTIKTKEGTTYYFGESALADKLVKGTLGQIQDKNFANEFELAELCSNQDCTQRDTSSPVLMVSKWLLKKIVTADGKEVVFNYAADQKTFSGQRYKTTTVYPRDVSWNSGIHRVVFDTEDRPDKGRDGDTMLKRIKTVNIQTKPQGQDYKNVRSYKIEYYPTNESPGAGMGENFTNTFPISFVKSIQEIGLDGQTATPKITFSYTATVPEMQGASGTNLGGYPAVYLGKIDNGTGAETTFKYESFNAEYRDKNGKSDVTKDGRFGSTRARVVAKTVRDNIENKSFRTEYKYPLLTNPVRPNAKGFSEQIATGTESPPTGLQFLGHEKVEVRTFDFDSNGGRLLSRMATLFYQTNEAASCFEPHLAKGSPREQIIYLGETSFEPKKTTSEYRYRTDTTINQDPNVCNRDRANQPYFVYSTKTKTISNDQAAVQTEIRDSRGESPIKQTLITGGENLEYDNYGNLKKSVNYGLVDGNGNDINLADNRYSFSSYLSNDSKHIYTLPYLSYSSYDSNCTPTNTACVRGKTEIFYDNQTNLASPTLTKALPTKQRVHLSSGKVVITKTEYDAWGNAIKIWSPAPNKETNNETDESGLILTSETKYDQYYHQLPEESKKWIKPAASNKAAYSQIERIEYDDTTRLLQIPKKVSSQIQKDREVFNFVEMEYDALGRVIKTYAKDPRTENQKLSDPISLTFYFDRPSDDLTKKGYSARSMILSSKDGKDGLTGKYTYTTTDTLYNGLGQIRQSQILKTSIDGVNRKLVTVPAKTTSTGQTIDTYEPQTADPVDMSPSQISSNAPSYIAGLPQTLMSHTEYDNLGRPTQSRVVDNTSGATMTTTNSYALNAIQSRSPKGVEKISISDVWGRAVYEITTSADGSQKLLTTNTYGQVLIDKPTRVETKPLLPANFKNLSSASTFSYDTTGRLISSTDPSLGTVEYNYDILGNKLKETQVSGSGYSKKTLRQSTFSYDSLGRLSTSYHGPTKLYRGGLRELTAFFYDEAPYSLGKLNRVDDPSGTTIYTYDSAQRLASTTKTIFDKTKTFSTSFDELSRPYLSILDADKVSYGYDSENRNQTVSLNGNSLQSLVLINKWGSTKKISYDGIGFRMFNENTYDSLGRIKKIHTEGNSVYFDQDVNYNPVGEIGSTTEQGSTKTFAYDGFSQLKNVTGSTSSSYSYDPFGRITSKTEGEEMGLEYPPSQGLAPLYAPSKITFKSAVMTAIPVVPILPTAVPTRRPLFGSRTYVPSSSQTTIPVASGMLLKYDYQGNLLHDDKNCYSYNVLGQLIEVKVKKTSSLSSCEALKPTDFSKIISMAYDFEGSLVFTGEYSLTFQPQKLLYIFGSIEEEYQKDSKGAMTLTNARLSLPLAGYVSVVKNKAGNAEKIYYVIKDYLSSTRQIVDRATGTIVGEKVDYTPYGSMVKKKL